MLESPKDRKNIFNSTKSMLLHGLDNQFYQISTWAWDLILQSSYVTDFEQMFSKPPMGSLQAVTLV